MRKWIIPTVLGLMVMGAIGIWGNTQRLANRNTEIFLDNKYQRAFFDLTDQVQSLEVLLSKSMVAADPRLDLSLLMDLRQPGPTAPGRFTGNTDFQIPDPGWGLRGQPGQAGQSGGGH